MGQTKPAYFDTIRDNAADYWDGLDANEDYRAPVMQLFSQVQSSQHVISELLQNADDASATAAWIQVKDNWFIFEHDGDDFTAEQFQALCRFGVSSKTNLHTIGFRGIGFKSVFSFGPLVEVRTPTLAVSFNERRFTLPSWIDDTKPVKRTVIRVRLTNEAAKQRALEEIKVWANHPTPLLFFHNLAQLVLDDITIKKEIVGKGPIPGSERVRLSGRQPLEVLHVISRDRPFPAEALEEIARERRTQLAGLNLGECSVELILQNRGDSRFYVVLPTDITSPLPFSCNAPFLQDPGRNSLKDPLQSPTNRWLLRRIGELAAESMLIWLSRTNLPLEERAGGYQLLPPRIAEGTEIAKVAARTVREGFAGRINTKPILLASTGELVQVSACQAIPPELFDVWSDAVLRRLFGKVRGHLLAPAVSSYVSRLQSWVSLENAKPVDIIRMLATTKWPVPHPGTDGLAQLWGFLEPYARNMRWAIHEPSIEQLQIVPVAGQDNLYRTKDVGIYSFTMNSLTADEQALLTRITPIVDPDWVDLVRRSARIQRTEISRAVNLAGSLYEILQIPVLTIDTLVSRAVKSAVTDDGADGELLVQLAHIAARHNLSVDQEFWFHCQDNLCRQVAAGLLANVDAETESILPSGWLAEHTVSDDYVDGKSLNQRLQWTRWLREKVGLRSFPSPSEHYVETDDRAEFVRIIEQRGGHEPSRYFGKRGTYMIVDQDFEPELWQGWEALASSDPMIWTRIVGQMLHAGAERSTEPVTAWHTPRTEPHELNTGPLAPGWLHRLRTLPCLPNRHGQPMIPSELMRVTPETAFLEDVEPFLLQDLDKPEYASMLDRLGVRTDPRSDLPLRRLRDMSRVNLPPISAVVTLYKTLDRLASRYSAEELAELRQAFQDESLVYASNDTWQTLSAVVQHDELGIAGILTLHPEVAALDLTLWDRLGMPKQASVEHVINWLARLPAGQRVDDKTVSVVKEALAASPREIWQRCRAWLDLTGCWQPASDLRWWATHNDTAQGLFTNIRRQIADARMLPSSLDLSFFESDLRPLDRELDQRITAARRIIGGKVPDWKGLLASGLLRYAAQRSTAQGNDANAIGERLDHDPAMRLLRAAWQPAQSIEVQPYLDGEPAGESHRRKALWRDDEILVVGREPEHHAELVKALAAPFSLQPVREAIVACVGRTPGWIRDYLREDLGIDTDLDMPQLVESLNHADAALVASPGNGARDERVPQPIAAAATAAITTTLVSPEEPDVTEPGPEEEGEEEEATTAAVVRRRQSSSRLEFLVQFFEQRGFARSANSKILRHPDGRTLSLYAGDGFNAILRDGQGRNVERYWIGDGSLRGGFEISANTWRLLQENADTSSVLLRDHRTGYVCHSMVDLLEFKDLNEIDVFPATYRIRQADAID